MSTDRSQTQKEPEDRLAATLFGRTRRRVLGLLYGKPDEALYVREIVRATGTAPGALQRELQELTKAGVLERSVRGQQVFYRADRSCPVFAELHSIVTKTSGLVDVIRGGLEPIQDRVRAAFVFGSLAKEQGRTESDVDLFVIGSVGFGDVVHALSSSQSKLGREINPVVQTPAEFHKRITRGDHFVTTVLSEPRLFVIGGADELERLGEEPMAGGAQDQPQGSRSTPRTRPKGSVRQRPQKPRS